MKRLSRMVMSILLICAMSMVGIAQAESTLVVNLNTMGDRSKLVLENGITEFETANPGYKCDLEWGMDVSDWGEYASQLMTKFAAGEQMDITWCAVEGLAFLAENGAVVPLDEYIAQSEDLTKWYEGISPEILKCMKWKDKIYGMPRGWNPAIICYNVDMFEEAGIKVDLETWSVDDFLAAAQKLTTKDRWGFVMGQDLPYYQCMLSGNNTYTMNEDWTESWWAKPRTIETFQLMYDMINTYKCTPMPEASIDATALFCSGQAAMYITGAWDAKTLNASGINWAFADIPMGPDMIKGISYGADFFMMSSSCQNPEVAMQLMKVLCGPEQQALIAEEAASVPSTIEAAYSDAFLSQGNGMNLLYDGVLEYPNARVICSPQFLPETQMEFYAQWADCLAGNISVEQFCTNMNDFTNECLANK